MKEVSWIIKCKTLVDTDDEDIARDQVDALFEGATWGEAEGRKLCLATYQLMAIVDVAEPHLEESDLEAK